MTCYRVLEVLGPGLLRVTSACHGLQLFTLRKLRRAKRCETCGKKLPKKSEAWAEVTSSAMNRSDRVCTPCMDLPS